MRFTPGFIGAALGCAGLLGIAAAPADMPADDGFRRALAALSAKRISARIRFLADDLLEGRGTGSAGLRDRGALHRVGVRRERPPTRRRRRHLPSKLRDGRCLDGSLERSDPGDAEREDRALKRLQLGALDAQSAAESRHRRADGLHRLWNHGAGDEMGRLSGFRRARQAPDLSRQRSSLGRSEILRRQGADLLRPVDL